MPTSTDLARMRATQEAHMFDTGVIQRFTSTSKNALNEKVVTYTDQAATICGIDMRPGSERHAANMTNLVYDATVRLPHDTVITARDHFELTHMFGEILSNAIVFSVVGPVQRGPSAVRLLLKRVEL